MPNNLITLTEKQYFEGLNLCIQRNATVLLSGTKALALGGHRIGAVVSNNQKLIDKIQTHSEITHSVSPISLSALDEAISSKYYQKELQERQQNLHKNAITILKYLNHQLEPYIEPAKLDAGLYIEVSLNQRNHLTYRALQTYANNNNILLLPITLFNGEGCSFRFSVTANTPEDINAKKHAIDQIKKFYDS